MIDKTILSIYVSYALGRRYVVAFESGRVDVLGDHNDPLWTADGVIMPGRLVVLSGSPSDDEVREIEHALGDAWLSCGHMEPPRPMLTGKELRRVKETFKELFTWRTIDGTTYGLRLATIETVVTETEVPT